jgi:glycosyltransferase involved in cell wall biosynthesis
VRILVLTWRDAGHPEAGGSETFVERVTTRLVELGHDVTLFTAAYPGGAPTERSAGRVQLRQGGRYGVYPRAAWHLLRNRRAYDVVLDIQNGVPFWSPLWTRRPVVAVVHHVHREQWPEVFGPVRARLGWWLESWLAPRVYARERYVTVSDATRRELATLGVDPARVTVVYSGNDLPDAAALEAVPRTTDPTLVVLGRLVPHKRVELAIDCVARYRPELPGLRLTVVGQGYWENELRAYADRLAVSDAVDFVGFVDDTTKHHRLAEAWLALLPSVKEGWGLVVVEAGVHATPTVAFRSAGGTAESVVDGVTGVLVDDDGEFIEVVGALLHDEERRAALGAGAVDHAWQFSWDSTAKGVASVLEEAALGTAGGNPATGQPAS